MDRLSDLMLRLGCRVRCRYCFVSFFIRKSDRIVFHLAVIFFPATPGTVHQGGGKSFIKYRILIHVQFYCNVFSHLAKPPHQTYCYAMQCYAMLYKTNLTLTHGCIFSTAFPKFSPLNIPTNPSGPFSTVPISAIFALKLPSFNHLPTFS